jgi:hypothetical protein
VNHVRAGITRKKIERIALKAFSLNIKKYSKSLRALKINSNLSKIKKSKKIP